MLIVILGLLFVGFKIILSIRLVLISIPFRAPGIAVVLNYHVYLFNWLIAMQHFQAFVHASIISKWGQA